MGDGVGYSLSDFLMFAPATYWRSIELYHLALWPGQLLALGAGLGCLALAPRTGALPRRTALLLLAGAWLWVGWAFHAQRYATINWAASYLALAFALQAVLLALLAWWVPASGAMPAAARSVGERAGWLLAAGAVLLYPLAGALVGRPWLQSDLFGMTPEPTALATLALLPMLARGLPRAARATAAVLPALSLAIGAATLWTMAQ